MSAPTVTTTTRNADSVSVFRESPRFKSITPSVGLLYSTSSNEPVSFESDADIAAFDTGDHMGSLIPKTGSVVLVVEWPPDSYRTFIAPIALLLV